MTIHFEERIPKNLETLLFHIEKLLRVIKIIQLPVREGDTCVGGGGEVEDRGKGDVGEEELFKTSV